MFEFKQALTEIALRCYFGDTNIEAINYGDYNHA